MFFCFSVQSQPKAPQFHPFLNVSSRHFSTLSQRLHVFWPTPRELHGKSANEQKLHCFIVRNTGSMLFSALKHEHHGISHIKLKAMCLFAFKARWFKPEALGKTSH